MRARASAGCFRDERTKHIAAWVRSGPWCTGQANATARVEQKPTKGSWCRRASRAACRIRARLARFCISLWAACGPAWATAAPRRLMNFARKHDSSRSPQPVCGRTIPMTSPLRRKRPTTRPSFRRMSEDGRRPELDCGLRIADCGLRCAFVAAICMLVVTLSTSFTAASDLVWRSGRGENAEPVAKLAVKQAAAKSSTTATAATEPKQAANALKFVRPSSLHVDSAVRQTAFEEDAPRLNRVPASDAGTRSIVVNRDDAADVFRSAQLTSGSSTSGGMSSSNTPTSPAADGLRSPFTETPGEPQL